MNEKIEKAAEALWIDQHLRGNRDIKYPWRSGMLPPHFWDGLYRDAKVSIEKFIELM